MRSKDKLRLSTLRLMSAALKDQDIAKRSDEEGEEPLSKTPRSFALLSKMVKQREDSAKAYEEAGRMELAEQERAEQAVIKEFLPKPLSEARGRGRRGGCDQDHRRQLDPGHGQGHGGLLKAATMPAAWISARSARWSRQRFADMSDTARKKPSGNTRVRAKEMIGARQSRPWPRATGCCVELSGQVKPCADARSAQPADLGMRKAARPARAVLQPGRAGCLSGRAGLPGVSAMAFSSRSAAMTGSPGPTACSSN